MSLINDALKRASESDRNRPAQAALPPLMQPAAARPGPRSASLLIAIALAVVGLAITGWAYWKSWADGRHAYAAVPVQAAAAEPAPASPKPVPAVNTAPAVTAAPAPAPIVSVAAVAVAPAPVPDEMPTNLTVKAIFYSKTSPHALINGSVVETGDRVNGVLITGISSNCVYVDWNGNTRELTLGGK
jgi:hypothetical protein